VSATSVVALAVGVFLVVVGVVLTASQLVRKGSSKRAPTRRMTAGVGPLKFALETTFPGLVIIGFGVLLIVLGVVT
jgi:hypothetical protein